MEAQDKKYKEHETDSQMISEPVTHLDSYAPAISVVRMPDEVPHTLEEALKDIEEGEKEFERGETYTHQEMMQMIWDKIDDYAG